MSWLWPEYIPRELVLTKQQRKVIHRQAWKLWSRNKWNFALYLTLLTFYILTVFFASDMGGHIATLIGARGLIYKLFRAAAPFVLLVSCFVIGGAILQRYRFAPCVYQATRQQGYEVCSKCGYWLKGLGDDIKHCPECGIQREAMPPPHESAGGTL